MEILKTYLAIPNEIIDKLRSGELHRDAAGVIRNMHGHIVAHLKEISPEKIPQEIPKIPMEQSIIAPMAAVAGITLLCTAYLSKQIRSLDAKLTQILDNQNTILKKIDELHNFNIKSLTENLFQARQFYINDEYEQACISCHKAAGTILNYILTNKIVYHLNSKEAFYYALHSLAATVYLHCEAQNKISQQKTITLLKNYEYAFTQITDKFQTEANELRYRMRTSVPSERDLAASQELLQSAPLRKSLQQAADCCHTEMLALNVLKDLSEKELEEVGTRGFLFLPA